MHAAAERIVHDPDVARFDSRPNAPMMRPSRLVPSRGGAESSALRNQIAVSIAQRGREIHIVAHDVGVGVRTIVNAISSTISQPVEDQLELDWIDPIFVFHACRIPISTRTLPQ